MMMIGVELLVCTSTMGYQISRQKTSKLPMAFACQLYNTYNACTRTYRYAFTIAVKKIAIINVDACSADL